MPRLPGWTLAVVGGLCFCAFLFGGMYLTGPWQKAVVATAIAMLVLVLPFFAGPEKKEREDR